MLEGRGALGVGGRPCLPPAGVEEDVCGVTRDSIVLYGLWGGLGGRLGPPLWALREGHLWGWGCLHLPRVIWGGFGASSALCVWQGAGAVTP